jgi:hypothetical protein
MPAGARLPDRDVRLLDEVRFAGRRGQLQRLGARLLLLRPLVGVTFFHQMVPIELDMAGVWVAVNATNALQLTAGAF